MNDDIVMITVHTSNPESLVQLSEVLNEQYPETRFIISTEEFNVTNLDKLEAQLDTLLQYVSSIKSVNNMEDRAAEAENQNVEGMAQKLMEYLNKQGEY